MCELQRIVGFKKEIRNSLVFSGKSTIFYISGQTGIHHSLKHNRQRFFPVIEKNEFTAMALNGKNLLALASKGLAPKLTIYNLKSSDKFILPGSNVNSIAEYVYVCFSDDDENIAAQGGTPSWPFLRWNLAKRCLLGVHFPFRLETEAKAFRFSFNPWNNNNIVTIGRFFFRIYHFKNENRFKEEAWHQFERSQKTFHSLTWLQEAEKFAVGTSDGIIYIFEKKQLIQQICLVEKLAQVSRILNKVGNIEDKNVTFLLSTKTGIICSYGGDSVLCLHWKIDKKDFNIVASFHIPKQVGCSTQDSKIVQLALNSNEDILAAATDDGQILTFFYKVPGLLESIGYEADFDVILNQQHKTPVICADTAVNNPVHVTCSSRTLILWDYQKRKLLHWERFDKIICSVSLHPLGINLAIGFSENCRVYNILNDKLEEIQEFHPKQYSQVKFSGGGHMLALVNKDFTELYSNLNFKKLAEFSNEDEVKCLLWKDNDHRLLLLNTAGKVYELDVVHRKKIWSFSSNAERFLTLTILKNFIYAGTSDKIWIFFNYTKTNEIEIHVNVTSLLMTEHMLLVGCENGMVCGFKIPLEGDALFQTHCHQGSIIDMTVKENGKLLLVTGEDCAISMWKMNNHSKNDMPLFNEVLIEQDIYNSNVNMISHLEKEFREKSIAAERKRAEHLQLQEKERKQLEEYYEDIQNQLKQTLIVLTEEKYNIQIDIEKKNLEQMAVLCEKREQNSADFHTKIEKEKEHFQKLTEERQTKEEEYTLVLCNIKKEIKVSTEKVKAIKEENENRLKELQKLLQMELDARQESVKQDEEFNRNLEEKVQARSEEMNLKFAFVLEKDWKENQLLVAVVEDLRAMMNYEKECSRTLDAEFGKKKRISDDLKQIKNQIKNRINDIKTDIQRKESVIEERIAMTKLLEEDSKEMAHMNSEANWRFEEYKKKLNEKSEELKQLNVELQELKAEKPNLTRKLKLLQREQFIMEEKLKSTEKSIADSTQKLFKEQMLLERYRKEFIDAIRDIESPFALRTALLRHLDKRVLRKSVKEEVFTGDMDPFMKFCRQRDHYESLINVVLNRKQEIQSSFRTTYTNLAKENSDWTAFVEALRRDLKQKQDKIEILEKCLKFRAKDFSKDPSETQRRFSSLYENLKRIEEKEDELIQKRIDLIEKQTTELQRLHGLVVVGEDGKIVRKIRH